MTPRLGAFVEAHGRAMVLVILSFALAGVVHFTWAVKADRMVPTRFAIVLLGLLAVRLVPREAMAKLRRLASRPERSPGVVPSADPAL